MKGIVLTLVHSIDSLIEVMCSTYVLILMHILLSGGYISLSKRFKMSSL